MASVLAEEQLVLKDIAHRTGITFPHLGSIDRNDRELIRIILPIAREWIPSVSEHTRGALYMLFLAPGALPYLDDILGWAHQATGTLDRELFVQILRLLVTPRTAERIWTTFKTLEPTDLDFLLLARLAAMNRTSSKAADRILEFLTSTAKRIQQGERVRKFAMGALQSYSRLRHPKVRRWFSHYLQSADPDLRAMARRSGNIKTGLPEGCRFARGAPDRARTVLSTEIDDDRLSNFLDELERDLNAQFSAPIQPHQVLENLAGHKGSFAM